MIKIIFENEQALFVFKPHGVLSVSSRLGAHEKRKVLSDLIKSKSKLWPVHRLDYEVSGLLLFAKTADFHRVANSWFEKKEIVKTYYALTSEIENAQNIELGKKLTWDSFLVRGKKRTFEAPYGQKSQTLALGLNPVDLLKKQMELRGLLIQAPDVKAWELQPLTGRPHQLRYELSHRGHPIIGDQLYGSTQHVFNKKGQTEKHAIALISSKMNFSQCQLRERYDIPIEVSLELNL